MIRTNLLKPEFKFKADDVSFISSIRNLEWLNYNKAGKEPAKQKGHLVVLHRNRLVQTSTRSSVLKDTITVENHSPTFPWYPQTLSLLSLGIAASGACSNTETAKPWVGRQKGFVAILDYDHYPPFSYQSLGSFGKMAPDVCLATMFNSSTLSRSSHLHLPWLCDWYLCHSPTRSNLVQLLYYQPSSNQQPNNTIDRIQNIC